MFLKKERRSLELKGQIACLGNDAPKKVCARALVIKDWRKQGTKDAKELPVIIVSTTIPYELIQWWGKEKVSALITSTGGITAHGWKVAREVMDQNMASHLIGITAVSGAHRKIKTGDLLEIEVINGSEAIIRKIRGG